MATLRKWLTEKGFDFKTGAIVFEDVRSDSHPNNTIDFYTSSVKSRIDSDHPILDHEFNDGYGSAQCPRIVARSGDFLFFPVQYDGATWLTKVNVNPEYYLDPDIPTPYPGGG